MWGSAVRKNSPPVTVRNAWRMNVGHSSVSTPQALALTGRLEETWLAISCIPKKVEASCRWALVLICGAWSLKFLLNTSPPDLLTM